jgi:hypothetical protein
MFRKCSNFDCGAPFDYREGQLIRSCEFPMDGQSLADQQHIEHFWLCGSCLKLYVFEYKVGTGMKIKLRVREEWERVALSFVIVA